jgi:hypothetical protein
MSCWLPFSFSADSPSSESEEGESQLPHFLEISGTRPNHNQENPDNYFAGMRCKNWEEANQASARKIEEMTKLGYQLKKLKIWFRDIYGNIHAVRDVEL